MSKIGIQDRATRILQTAFRNEKEENERYRHSLVVLRQKMQTLVGTVHEVQHVLYNMSFVVKKSFDELLSISGNVNQCHIWKNEVGKLLTLIDEKMNASLDSFKSLDNMEYIASILNETKTNMQMSKECRENPSSRSNYTKINARQYSSCKKLLKDGHDRSGVYVIYLSEANRETKVFCDQETDGGGWTVFQRRKDGSVNFYRNWTDYKSGFGDAEGEFWLGNDIIHTMITKGDGKLRIELKDFEGNSAYTIYDKFSVGPESSGYKLEVGSYSGTAGDSLKYHNGMMFSTDDRDNDIWTNGDQCVKTFKGCWWYKGCYQSNLNGAYHESEEDSNEDGLVWSTWKGFRKSMQYVEMKFK